MTGKSALVAELYKSVVEKNGFFISGKSMISNNKPYCAWHEAINNFCDDLLLKDQATIDSYKSKIQDAVGQEGKVLTNVINNLHLIIGEQPTISDAFGVEAKRRFNFVFIKFLKAISLIESPIVLTLEDLHWSDSESLALLSALLTEKKIKNFMFVGTYRGGEVQNNHPLSHLFKEIKDIGINTTEINLENLDHESVNDLISDSLCVSQLETYPLTAFIHETTNGNPFFVNQSLRSLHENHSISFCCQKSKWIFDASLFDENDMSNNVSQLLRQKILKYDQNIQEALKIASIFSSPFSLPILRRVVNDNKVIDGTLATGMIIQSKGSDSMYRFVHDKIEEVVSSLLPADCSELLFYLGKKLCFLFTPEELVENIFTVISLFDHVQSKIEDLEERLKIAELFMQAGIKALEVCAYKKAAEYSNKGIKFLREDCWKTHYDLTRKLHELAAKTAYCVADYTSMDTFLNVISSNAIDVLHLVAPMHLKIRLFNDKRMYDSAIKTALDYLNTLDATICMSPNDSSIITEIQSIKQVISERSVEDVLNMKEMNDESALACMTILSSIQTSSYFANLQLSIVVCLRMIQISLSKGLTKYAPAAFCSFGTVLSLKRESNVDKAGYYFGKLALALLKKSQIKEIIPMVYNTFYIGISPFYAPIHDAFEPLLQSSIICLETGLHEDGIHSSYCYFHYALLR